MLVRDIMTRPVVTVPPGTPVRAVAALLSGRGFTALPVVDDAGGLVGIVTEADLLRDRLRHDPRSPLLSRELDAGGPPSRVADVMTVDVVTARTWTDVADLVAEMQDRGIRSVPVVDAGQVVGIVSRRDVLGTLTRADAAIATDVRRRLENYAGPERWTVSVLGGVVTLTDPYTDPVERHTATVVAAAVRGVADVRVVPAP
jgi:CBS domain-containing protein